jgi:DNA repair protein RadC
MTSFWQVADSSPAQWPMQRALTEPASMADAELIQQICSIDISKAQEIVERVNQLRDASANELIGAGMTQKQAAKLLAAIELGKRAFTVSARIGSMSDPQSAASYLQYDLGHLAIEKGALLILDCKHGLIRKEIFSIGSQGECIIDPKVVFEKILRHQGNRFVLAHNHPSGLLEPSPEDIKLTENFVKASKLMNTPMIDHLVIGAGKHHSIRESHYYLWDDCDF